MTIKLTRDRIVAPFTVGIDVREKHPYTFTGIVADGPDKRTLIVPVEQRTLVTADYTITAPMDLTAALGVERKSFKDLIGTIAGSRDRFERELARLDEMLCSHIVVESTLDYVLEHCHERTRMPAKAIHRSLISWTMRFPTVHWWWTGNRILAERTCYRILERFWKQESK